MTSDERVQIFVPSPQGTPYNTITKTSAGPNFAPLFAPNRAPNEPYRSLTPLNFSASPAPPPNIPEVVLSTSGQEPDVILATSGQETEITTVQETSLEMVKISMISSSTTSTTEVATQQTDRTIANDLDSLPMDDQPVSLSQIHLEVLDD